MSFLRSHNSLFADKTLIQKYNASFNFDWNDYRSIEANEKKLSEIVAYLTRPDIVEQALKSDEKYDLAALCYKIATFYNHVKRNPDAALTQLKIAEQVLAGEALAWAQNHFAFSYHQKFAVTRVTEYANQSLQYCDQVEKAYLSSDEPQHIKIVAFAYCVRALTEYEMKQTNEALASYRFALDLYEELGEEDDQYARAKNRWAMMLAENNQIKAARQAFEELAIYWDQHSDKFNIYRARADETFGDFLAKYGDATAALNKYHRACDTLLLTDGPDSRFTKALQQKISELEQKIQQEKKPGYSPSMYANKKAANTAATQNPEIINRPRI